jgi:hypothetical protein
MQGRTEFLRPAIAALTFAASAIALAPAGNAAPADTCLAAPKGATPQGSHWYYRLERPAMRKCWYLAEKGRTVAQRAVAPAAPQAEPDEETDAPSAPIASVLPAPAANAPAANAASVPAAEPQPVITTLVTRNVSNADQIAQAPAAPDSTQPRAAPNLSPGTMATEAPPLAPEQAPSDPQAAKAAAEQPAPQGAAAAAPEPESASTEPMTTLQLLLGAIALTGLLASASFLVMAALRRRNNVLDIRREMDALPFEPSPETAVEDSPTLRLMPAIDAIRQRDDIDEVLERMARRRRAA